MALFQDEAVSIVLARAGQTLISAADLDFTDTLINRDYFGPLALEYAELRPGVATLGNVQIPTTGYALPTYARNIVNVYPDVLNLIVPYRSIRPVNKSTWFVDGGVLRFKFWTMLGPYKIEYATDYAVSYGSATYEPLIITSLSFAFPLKAKLAVGSLVLSADNRTMVETGPPVNDVAPMSGTLGTGSVNHSTLVASVSISGSLEDVAGKPLSVTFTATNPYIGGLDSNDPHFLEFFAARFLPGFAAAKANLEMENFPFSVNRDQLLTYARECAKQFEDNKGSFGKWWLF